VLLLLLYLLLQLLFVFAVILTLSEVEGEGSRYPKLTKPSEPFSHVIPAFAVAFALTVAPSPIEGKEVP
jgi:hypothetical protein